MKKAPILTLAAILAATTAWLAGATHYSASAEAVDTARIGSESDGPSIEADETDDAKSPGTSAREFLRKARAKLHEYRSIEARLIETAAIGNRKFKATGSYLQGPGLKLRMSLDLRLGPDGGYQGSLLQVCDGQVLWTSHIVGPTKPSEREADASEETEAEGGEEGGTRRPNREQRITRRDVRQILAEASAAERSSHNRLVAELGLGGIPELLASLEETMVFSKPRTNQIDGKPFVVLEGRWKMQVLEHFLDADELQELRDKETKRTKLPLLPKHVPDVVRIYFDRDSLFPRRVLYLKRRAADEPLRPMLSLNFVDVVLNAPVNENEFNFVPPDKVVPEDVTRRYLDRIERASGGGSG